MNELHRELAPIDERGWRAIESEAKETLQAALAARRLVDFRGDLGWEASAVSIGRAERLAEGPIPDVEARVRRVLPLVEIRSSFALRREEIEAVGRGIGQPQFDELVTAAQRLARAEDATVFYGWEKAGIAGLCSESPHEAVSLSADYNRYPEAVTAASERLREASVTGPYALALGPRCYAGLAQTSGEGGYPVLRHVGRLIDGPVIWAPALEGAVLLSTRGGDFELVVGRDAAIGYLDHDAEVVRLYLEESFTFRLLGPEAAVPLRYGN